ncbi:MAG TPA: ABC transporter substrate-binding protein [Dehalococcoidia bacterium]|nr:ABC transporter substrate-binding protein [Dehalococcoidia bacterium]
MASYWERVLARRASRRRAMAAAGALGGAAAFLAACGGGEEAPSGPKDTSGLVVEPQDTSKSAKRGGVFKWSQSSEPNHFDGMAQGQAQLNIYNSLAYGSLVQNKPGYKEPSSNTEVVPDLAESWEVSPDKLVVTFKLRQGVKWHNKPPVNGREFDSEDVVKNWERYVSLPSNNRAANANSFNPNAPIVSVTASDKYTVQYKLNRPTSFFFQRLATMITGEAGSQYPKEALAGTFDPRTSQIGTGGFMLDKYTPSVGFTYKRNPDYWNKTEPYIETLEIPIIGDPAQGLAQFKAGNVFTYGVLPQDVLTVKKETPAISMYRSIISGANPAAIIGFGWLPLPDGQKSPFLDIRVRQALSLSFDRDAFIDTFSNVSKFQAEGLPVETFYYTAQAYVPDVWLDPRSKEFGPNAFFYTYNPAEAKKLISAAYPNGLPEIESKFISGPQFGLDHQQQVEVLHQYAREVGFKIKPQPIDYNLEYLPKIVTQQGKFHGWAFRFGATSSADPLDFYIWRYWSKSGPTSGSLGFGGPDGSLGDQSGDPIVDSLIEKAYAELEAAKRIEIIHDLQRHLAKEQYGVSRPGVGSGFALAWPVVGNYAVFQGDSRAVVPGGGGGPYTWWVDDTKAPLKS